MIDDTYVNEDYLLVRLSVTTGSYPQVDHRDVLYGGEGMVTE